MKSLKLRSYIVAPKDHYLLSCDLSQAESWIVAYLSNDLNMKIALKNGIFHETTTWTIFDLPENTIVSAEQRYVGKKTNHGTAYRITPERFVEEYNLESLDGSVISLRFGRQCIDKWHGKYRGVKSWWADIDYTLKTNHNTLVTPYGFPCTWYGPESNELKKQATAFVPQSTVAEHFNGEIQVGNEIPGGLLEFDKLLPPEVRIINQSHDSFMAEVPKPIIMDIYYLAKQCFVRPIIIKGEECVIPMDGEYGERWKEGMVKIKE